MGMQAKISKHRNTFFFCAFLFVAGIALITFWPWMHNHILIKQLQLQPNTVIYKFWNEPPQPLYLDVYFFNWTNPEDFFNKSIKPKFQEIGPYRFQEFPTKTAIQFHDQNSTVSYKKQSRYIFLPHLSKGRLDDLITSVNVIALTSANQARGWNIIKVKGVDLSLAFFGQKIHLTKTADELLFKGYDDPIISVARDIAKIMDISVPFDKFGWFYMRNESSLLTGDFNVDTGKLDIAKLGKLRQWNFQKKSNFFEGECGNLEGASAGELFPPFTAAAMQPMSVFSPEICRNVIMDFDQQTEVHGIIGMKYVSGARTVDNGTKFRENTCFCSGECVPSGVLNITSCRLGAPIFISYPHFYDADPFYLEQIEGMSPVKDKHEFSMTLEPKTSLPLEIKGRFQLNVLINPIKNINMYKNVPRKFLPVLWFAQNFKVNNDLALKIKLTLNSEFLGQLLGLLLTVSSTLWILFILSKKESKKDEPQEENSLKTIRLLPEASPLIK